MKNIPTIINEYDLPAQPSTPLIPLHYQRFQQIRQLIRREHSTLQSFEHQRQNNALQVRPMHTRIITRPRRACVESALIPIQQKGLLIEPCRSPLRRRTQLQRRMVAKRQPHRLGDVEGACGGDLGKGLGHERLRAIGGEVGLADDVGAVQARQGREDEVPDVRGAAAARQVEGARRGVRDGVDELEAVGQAGVGEDADVAGLVDPAREDGEFALVGAQGRQDGGEGRDGDDELLGFDELGAAAAVDFEGHRGVGALGVHDGGGEEDVRAEELGGFVVEDAVVERGGQQKALVCGSVEVDGAELIENVGCRLSEDVAGVGDEGPNGRKGGLEVVLFDEVAEGQE